jgi:hypothetical protein
MTKHSVDMSDYDDSRAAGQYTGEEPRRGIYEGALVSVKDHTSNAGNEGLEWCYAITKGEFKGWRGYQYSNMEKSSTLWKTQALIAATFGKKTGNVAVDTDNDGAKMVKKANPVMLRIKQEMYEGEMKARLTIVIAKESDEDDDDDEDDNEDPFAS